MARLRPLMPDDVETLASWGLDAELCAAAEWTVGKPLNYHREYWTRLIESPPEDLLRLAVVADGDRVVGYTDLFGQDSAERELGFVIGERAMWGRGLGTMAASLTLEHGFSILGLSTIVAEAWDANDGSIRILRKIGMRETGRGETGVYLEKPTFMRRFVVHAIDWRNRNHSEKCR